MNVPAPRENPANVFDLPDVPVSKDDASAALRARAFEIHPDNTDALREFARWIVALEDQGATFREVVGRAREALGESRLIVHARMYGVGADHDLAQALTNVEEASAIYWTTNLLRHDLALVLDGVGLFYDVPRPERP